MSLYEVAVHLGLLRDVHRFGPDKLQQWNGDTCVPGRDFRLGLHQVAPAALQVGGWGAVQSHVGQLVVEHAVVFGLDLVSLCIGHQAFRDQLVGVGVRDALTRSAEMSFRFSNTTYSFPNRAGQFITS